MMDGEEDFDENEDENEMEDTDENNNHVYGQMGEESNEHQPQYSAHSLNRRKMASSGVSNRVKHQEVDGDDDLVDEEEDEDEPEQRHTLNSGEDELEDEENEENDFEDEESAPKNTNSNAEQYHLASSEIISNMS